MAKMRLFARLNLRLFETQVTGMNAVGNDLSPVMKEYYDGLVIDNATPNLVHDQFGDDYPIPKGRGKIIKFRRYSSLSPAG